MACVRYFIIEAKSMATNLPSELITTRLRYQGWDQHHGCQLASPSFASVLMESVLLNI